MGNRTSKKKEMVEDEEEETVKILLLGSCLGISLILSQTKGNSWAGKSTFFRLINYMFSEEQLETKGGHFNLEMEETRIWICSFIVDIVHRTLTYHIESLTKSQEV